jgi:hypothetical protein
MNTVLLITAVIGGILAMSKVLTSIYAAWKRVDEFLDDWNGAPARPGHRAIPSMPQRMDQVEHRLEALEGQISNGGTT